MASKQDAEAGWEIYKEADYALTLGEINQRLAERKFAPVSNRTFRHYGKLHRFGYARYVPINQLDVKTLTDPFVDRSSRIRQHPIQTLTPATLTVWRSDILTDFTGNAIELSLHEIVIRISGQQAVAFFDDLGQKSVLGQVTIGDTSRVGEIERLSLDVKTQLAIIRVGFNDSLDASEFDRTIKPETLNLTISIPFPANGDIETAVQALYWISTALDAATAVASEIATSLDQPAVFPRPRVVSITTGSIQVVVDIAFDVAKVFSAVGLTLTLMRQQYYRGSKERQESLKLRWENEKLGVYRKFGWRDLVDKLRRSKHERAGTEEEVAALDADETKNIEKVVVQQLIPAVDRLLELGAGELEIAGDKSLMDGIPSWLSELEEPQQEAS